METNLKNYSLLRSMTTNLTLKKWILGKDDEHQIYTRGRRDRYDLLMCYCCGVYSVTTITVFVSTSLSPPPLHHHYHHHHHPPPLPSCCFSKERSWGGGAADEDVCWVFCLSISLSSRVWGPSDVTGMAEADWLTGEMGAWLSSDAIAPTTTSCSFRLLWTGPEPAPTDQDS